MVNNQSWMDAINDFDCEINSVDYEQISSEEKLAKILDIADRLIKFCTPCECKSEK